MNSKARPFMDTLRDIEAGVLLNELTEAQHSLIDAVCAKIEGDIIDVPLYEATF